MPLYNFDPTDDEPHWEADLLEDDRDQQMVLNVSEYQNDCMLQINDNFLFWNLFWSLKVVYINWGAGIINWAQELKGFSIKSEKKHPCVPKGLKQWYCMKHNRGWCTWATAGTRQVLIMWSVNKRANNNVSEEEQSFSHALAVACKVPNWRVTRHVQKVWTGVLLWSTSGLLSKMLWGRGEKLRGCEEELGPGNEASQRFGHNQQSEDGWWSNRGREQQKLEGPK